MSDENQATDTLSSILAAGQETVELGERLKRRLQEVATLISSSRPEGDALAKVRADLVNLKTAVRLATKAWDEHAEFKASVGQDD